jgi:hypothetical protein
MIGKPSCGRPVSRDVWLESVGLCSARRRLGRRSRFTLGASLPAPLAFLTTAARAGHRHSAQGSNPLTPTIKSMFVFMPPCRRRLPCAVRGRFPIIAMPAPPKSRGSTWNRSLLGASARLEVHRGRQADPSSQQTTVEPASIIVALTTASLSPGVGVDDKGDVDETRPGRDIGEVRDPQRVRSRCLELPVHVVERTRRRLVADRGSDRLAMDNTS